MANIDVTNLRAFRQELSQLPKDWELEEISIPREFRGYVERLNNKSGVQVQDAIQFLDKLLKTAGSDGQLSAQEYERKFSSLGVRAGAKSAVDAAFRIGGARVAPPVDPQVRSAIDRLAVGTLRDGERVELLALLIRQPSATLTRLIRSFPGEARPAQDKIVLQVLFEQRGATRSEAQQQVMLADRYGINTVVTPGGDLGMWPASTNPATVSRVLSENKTLEPRIKTYLQQYLDSPPQK
jgi:hypothetical protein